MTRTLAIIAAATVLTLGAVSCTDSSDEPSASTASVPSTTVEENPSVEEPGGEIQTTDPIDVPDASDVSTAPLPAEEFCALIEATAGELTEEPTEEAQFASLDDKIRQARSGAPTEISAEINLWSSAFTEFVNDLQAGVEPNEAGPSMLASNVVEASNALAAWADANCEVTPPS